MVIASKTRERYVKKIEITSFYYGFPVILRAMTNLETDRDNITPISSILTLGKSIVLGNG